MSAKETTELRGRNEAELHQDLESAHQALFNLRFQAATRQLADVSQIAKAKRRIARLKTLARERAILTEADAAGNRE
jgi:large subunit ribosomal protein L29